MKLEYKLTRKELGDFLTYLYWRDNLPGTIVYALLSGGAFFAFISTGRNFNLEKGLICTGILIVFYMLVIHFLMKRSGNRFREHGPTLGRKQVELTEDSFISSDAFQDCKTKWTAFTHVETKRYALYLFMENVTAIVIPKSAFSDENALQYFINYVKERVEAAKAVSIHEVTAITSQDHSAQ